MPEAERPTWNVICAGIPSRLTQLVGEFCALNPGCHYAGTDDSPELPMAARHTADPNLVVYASRWLATAGDRGLRAIQESAPGSRVVLVGPLPAAVPVAGLLRFGVCGLLTEEPATLDALGRVLNAVIAGELWFTRVEMAQLVQYLETALNQLGSQTSPEIPGLTHRENAVLREVQLGRSNKDIARSLGIAEHTVKIHVQHIFQKLRLHRRTDLLLLRFKRNEDGPLNA